VLDLQYIFRFLERYPNTDNIIVNGGDPLMMKPEYYWDIIQHLDDIGYTHTKLSLTTNLWPFYKNPEKWVELFNHPRVDITTSFQFGGGRLKGDLSEFSVEDFWNVSNLMLERCGERPDFIAVITQDNAASAIENVLLAKEMGVNCKLNYAMSSGVQKIDPRSGHVMGQLGKPFVLADMYKIYVQLWDMGLADWEHNTDQMSVRLRRDAHTTCPQNRNCDESIRVLQPNGDYYSCGSFGDDFAYAIPFEEEMAGANLRPLHNAPELQTMKQSCWECPMFQICNGCHKTIKDLKDNNLVERHCKTMKGLAQQIININEMQDVLVPTPYVREYE
jgi:radical SAM protein with 4Fe4S-binding SPASM domain